jgi:hypothetical protein
MLAADYIATLRAGGWRTAITELRRHGIGALQLADTAMAAGIPWSPVGAARIERLPNGSWTPREDGIPALILPAVDDGDCIDLVAFTPDEPRRLHCRQRDAWCVGADRYWWLRWCLETGGTEPPLRVDDDAIAWLRAGGAGLLITDWRRAALHLADLPAVHAASPRIAERLDAAWRRRAPRLLVSREERAAA